MVFDVEGREGGGLLKPADLNSAGFGVLPEPYVVLHSMNSSE